MSANSKFQVIPMLKDIFNDLGLEDDCSEVIYNYSNMVEKLTPPKKNVPNGIKMGTKSLGKGKNQILLPSKATVLPCILYILMG